MGIISEIHENDGHVTIGPVRADQAGELPAFVPKHTRNPPQDVTIGSSITADGRTAIFELDWPDGDNKARTNAVKWSAKVQVKADEEFDWGGSG